jgi:hypothetical protein
VKDSMTRSDLVVKKKRDGQNKNELAEKKLTK